MKVWKLQIKEIGNDNILTPQLWADVNEEYVINFYGLKNPDIEWYKIEYEYIY